MSNVEVPYSTHATYHVALHSRRREGTSAVRYSKFVIHYSSFVLNRRTEVLRRGGAANRMLNVEMPDFSGKEEGSVGRKNAD